MPGPLSDLDFEIRGPEGVAVLNLLANLPRACCGASSGRPQLNNRLSVRTTAKAANAAVRRNSNLSTFGSITMPPLSPAGPSRRPSSCAGPSPAASC